MFRRRRILIAAGLLVAGVALLLVPLLVIQVATDPRVVKGESDQLVDRLKSLGRDVEYVVFDDEGHGFTKRANEQKAYGLAAGWLEQHLLS